MVDARDDPRDHWVAVGPQLRGPRYRMLVCTDPHNGISASYLEDVRAEQVLARVGDREPGVTERCAAGSDIEGHRGDGPQWRRRTAA